MILGIDRGHNLYNAMYSGFISPDLEVEQNLNIETFVREYYGK